MISGDCLQQVFNLAYSLHPERVVAWEVTSESLKVSRAMSEAQGARPVASRPYKQKLEDSNLLRRSVFAVSEKWERDQESRSPKKTPYYTPTTDDLLYRYIKTLVWHSMDRTSSVYAAVGIGSLLFRYRTSEIASVAIDIFDTENIRRVKRWLSDKIESRFRDVMVIPDGSSGGVQQPSEYQLSFVAKSLSTLAPLVPDHPQSCTPAGTLLDEYFAYDSVRSEPERIHIIMNAECGGWARLIDEYNQSQSHSDSCLLAEPTEKLRLPMFDNEFNGPCDGGGGEDGGGGGGGGEPAFDERFAPEPLSPVELRALIALSGARDGV